MPNRQKNSVILTINKAATTLSRGGDKIPEHKKQMIKNIIIEAITENREMFREGDATIPENLLKEADAKEVSPALLSYCFMTLRP
mmetsp:Transcript_15181/g.23436  ORF Transcript_15181/g.23436 Transcript_15181/m.23436 type:complete len:85 (-) Transcript_15181:481-735(-)